MNDRDRGHGGFVCVYQGIALVDAPVDEADEMHPATHELDGPAGKGRFAAG